jgi:uncharacterized protein (TIGR03382 family)
MMNNQSQQKWSVARALCACACARQLGLLIVAVVMLAPGSANAWTIGTQLDIDGCHERITAAALRAARGTAPTAPVIKPTRDEAAMIDDVQFAPPTDFIADLGGMTLLLAVRDNDLKGNNPLDSLSLVEVHGDPLTQDEHCIRGADDDGEEGNATALAACRAFIVMRATQALDGLAADGSVDATHRMPLAVYVSFAGHIKPELPVFYVRMGQAMHALEDGFTHTYRDAEGMKVTFVLNWIDNVTGSASDETRDGPVHLAGLDHCETDDPLVARNYRNATEAATALLAAALDPTLSRDRKIAAFEELTGKYLTYQPGCSIDNHYCNAPEPSVPDPTGCNAAGQGHVSWLIALALASVLVLRRRRGTAAPVVLVLIMAAPSYADTPPAEAPAVPVVPQEPGDTADQQQGKEPGRDESTPTLRELTEVREQKRLGPPLGFTTMVGGSLVHSAATVGIGVRYRLDEKWLIGADMEWNPWFRSAPMTMEAGVGSAYATIVRRFPMKFDRVNLRTSLHLGASTLLFDVNGAPKYSIGPFASFTPLGIDYDLGNAMRLVLDPVEIAVPMPHVGQLPLYYEQFRLMFGIQIGA